mgnify:CR=1 FL=1
MPDIRGILYQPVDLEKFNAQSVNSTPPDNLQSIINSGARIMLTPSRISKPGMVNDKNLRALIPVLAQLKAMGENYHGIVIGEDQSPEKVCRYSCYLSPTGTFWTYCCRSSCLWYSCSW